MTEPEAASAIVAEPATSFWTRSSRFAVPMLWLLSGLAFIFTFAPYRVLPDIFLLGFVILWIKNPHLRKARMLAMVFTAFLLAGTASFGSLDYGLPQEGDPSTCAEG